MIGSERIRAWGSTGRFSRLRRSVEGASSYENKAKTTFTFWSPPRERYEAEYEKRETLHFHLSILR